MPFTKCIYCNAWHFCIAHMLDGSNQRKYFKNKMSGVSATKWNTGKGLKTNCLIMHLNVPLMSFVDDFLGLAIKVKGKKE